MNAIYKAYIELYVRASKHEPRPDLLIWPETACPGVYLDGNEKQVDDFKKLAEYCQASHLLGVETRVLDNEGKTKAQYNSALFIPFGQAGTMDRYDKFHRVPFGEYVPLRDWLPFMNWFAPYDFDYSIHSGEKMTRFVLATREGQQSKYRFGVLICFEDSDPFLARSYGTTAKDGPPVDFLVNISNDGWFDTTCEHEEHLALCRFRAIECRRAVVRAVNMGISAVIDGNGRVLKPRTLPGGDGPKLWVIDNANGTAPGLPESEWPAFKNVDGVLIARVPIDRRESFYVRFGDWLPWGCWIFVVGGLLWRCLTHLVPKLRFGE